MSLDLLTSLWCNSWSGARICFQGCWVGSQRDACSCNTWSRFDAILNVIKCFLSYLDLSEMFGFFLCSWPGAAWSRQRVDKVCCFDESGIKSTNHLYLISFIIIFYFYLQVHFSFLIYLCYRWWHQKISEDKFWHMVKGKILWLHFWI